MHVSSSITMPVSFCHSFHFWNAQLLFMHSSYCYRNTFSEVQTVSEGPLTMLSYGGMQRLHLADDDAVNWLEQTTMKALTKWNELIEGMLMWRVKESVSSWTSQTCWTQVSWSAWIHCLPMVKFRVCLRVTRWRHWWRSARKVHRERVWCSTHRKNCTSGLHSRYAIWPFDSVCFMLTAPKGVI